MWRSRGLLGQLRGLCSLIAVFLCLLVSSTHGLAQNASTIGAGKITTFAGLPPGDVQSGSEQDDIPATQLHFNGTPQAVIVDSNGNVYVATAAANYNLVYEIYESGTSPLLQFRTTSPTVGNIYIIAGTVNQDCNAGSDCGDGGSALSAQLNGPSALAFDASGNLLIVDEFTSTIRKVDAKTGNISSIIGDPMHAQTGYTGEGVPAAGALLNFPTDLIFDKNGNLFISDGNNSIVRKVDAKTNTITTVAGTLPSGGNAVFCGAAPCGDGGLATNAQLNFPIAIALDGANNLYISDQGSSTIRKVDAKTGLIETVAGNMPAAGSTDPYPNLCTTAPCNDNGPATAALLNVPYAVQPDGSGNLLIADAGDSSLRVVDTSGNIHAVVGQILLPGAYGGDDGPAVNAQLNYPEGFAFDSTGNLFVADSNNNIIRKVTIPPPLTPQTITFNPLSDVVYGVAPITLDATASSGLQVTYSVTGSASVAGSTLTVTGVGKITVTANQAGDSNYGMATPVSQSFNATAAALTVTADNISRQPGQANPTLTYKIAGFVNGDTSTVVTGAPVLTTTATTNSPIGQYPINVAKGTLSATNYTFTLVNGTLTVTGGQTQTITFSPLPNLTYGSANSTFTLGATASSKLPVTYSVTGPAKLQGSTLTVTGAGTVAVTANQSGNSTYAAAPPVTQSFTVAPAALSITAAPATRPFNQPNPTFSYVAKGFVSGDTASVLSGAPSYSTTATQTSDPGNYPITLVQGTLFAQNYTFTFVPGTLTVTQASQAITFPTLPPVTLDSAFQSIALQATASSGLAVQYTATGPVTINPDSTFTVTGVGPATITASQPGNKDYAAATPVTQSFTVGQKTLQVVAVSLSRPFGADNPPLTYQFGLSNVTLAPGEVTGVPNLSTTANAQSPTGTYPIVITQGSLSSAVDSFQFVNGTLTVTPAASYILTVNPGSVTMPVGQSRQVTVTLTPVNNYVGSITLGCSGLPAGVTCTASPATLSAIPGNGTASQAVSGTITISAGQVVAANATDRGNILAAGLLYLPGGLAGLWLAVNRRRFSKKTSLLSICLLLSVLATTAGMTACGSTSGSKTGGVVAGTSQIMITGTGAATPGTTNLSQSVGLTVTIQ